MTNKIHDQDLKFWHWTTISWTEFKLVQRNATWTIADHRPTAKCQTPLHEHRLRTPPTDTINGQAHNNSTACGTINSSPTDKQFATSQHVDMSRCWALALRCGKFVAELLWARPLVVSVGGVVQHVRSRCPCSGVWPLTHVLLLHAPWRSWSLFAVYVINQPVHRT